MPVFGLGWAYGRAVAPIHAASNPAAELLSAMVGEASMLLDEAGRPIARTAAADAMLDAGIVVGVDQRGVLTLALQGRMLEVLRVLRTQDGQARPLVHLTLSGKGSTAWAALRLIRRQTAERWHLLLSHKPPALTAEVLRQQWPDMTRKQAELCMLLWSGVQPMSAAEHMGIAISTFRSHMVELYRMTETNHAVELLAALRKKANQ